jgi:hypothetical protein
MAVTEIRSFKVFVTWLREHGHRGGWFGRVGPDERCLLVSREPAPRIIWRGWRRSDLRLFPLQLPPASPVDGAKAWWRDVLEQRIVDFFRSPDCSVYCMARAGTWRALPEWCMDGLKSQWEVITLEAFEADVGLDLCREMIVEHGLLGISIRRLPSPALQGRKDGRRGRAAGAKAGRRGRGDLKD